MRKTNPHISFEQLLLKGEFQALRGKALRIGLSRNQLILAMISALTLYATGLSLGTLRYLNDKLSDPFVSWVPISIPEHIARDVTQMKAINNILESPDIQEQYHFKEATSYFNAALNFCMYDGTGRTKLIKGRTIEASDPLLTNLLAEDNMIVRYDSYDFHGSDFALIVTEDLLNELKCPQGIGVMYVNGGTLVSQSQAGENSLIGPENIPLPIKAVVKRLPGRSLYLATSYFLKSWINPKNEMLRPGVFWRQSAEISLMLRPDLADKRGQAFRSAVDQYAAQLSAHIGKKTNVIPSTNPSISVLSELATIVVEADTTFLAQGNMAALVAGVMNPGALPGFKPNIDYYVAYSSYSSSDANYEKANDELSIFFTELDSVESFAKFVQERFNTNAKDVQSQIRIDIEKIIDKKNFEFIRKLNIFVAVLLILLGLLSAVLFVWTLVVNHFERVRKNIGTILAFGARDNVLNWIYVKIVTRLMLISVGLGLAMALVLGGFTQIFLSLEKGVRYFDPFSPGFGIAVFLLFAIPVLTTLFVSRRLLQQTPGDLVYER